MKNYKLLFAYKESYKRYIKDNKNECVVYSWEGFSRVNINDIKYKKKRN